MSNKEMGIYFSKSVSAFVANKYKISITTMDSSIRFYAKNVALPYETLNTVDDIYINDITLARPKNILSVQTPVEITVNFRMDPTNRILAELENIFNSNHNLAKFEAVKYREEKKSHLVTVSVEVYNPSGKIVNSKTYHSCTILSMKDYTVDSSDRKFKEYEVVFTSNGKEPLQYKNTAAGGTLGGTATVVKCSALRDEFHKALQAYYSEASRGAPDGPKAPYFISILKKNNIPELLKQLKSSTKCRPIEKIKMSASVDATDMPMMNKYLSENGIEESDLDRA